MACLHVSFGIDLPSELQVAWESVWMLLICDVYVWGRDTKKRGFLGLEDGYLVSQI